MSKQNINTMAKLKLSLKSSSKTKNTKMKNSEAIKVISEWFVRPEPKVDEAKQPYYLGPCDLRHLTTKTIHKGSLFELKDPNPTRPEEVQSIVEKLKHSLSIALFQFYPLAGRLQTKKYEDDHASLIYVDCINGPGARLVHATYVDLTVSDILSSIDLHPAVESFFDLGERTINYDGHTNPLLSIQVTELHDGMFIGFTVNHAVLDGTSFIHFVTTLSEIFNSGEVNPIQISRNPVFKMYVAEGYGPIFNLPYLEPEEFVSRGYNEGPELRERIFHFGPESMKRLKAKANEDPQVMISSFMALSGLVWRSITRAYEVSGHEETSFALIVSARSRLDPPLSANYFGNYVGMITGRCTVEELLSQNLCWASRVLQQEVKKKTHEKICEDLEMICSRPIVFHPGGSQPELNKGVKIMNAGSSRFDMYEPEFGMGRAVAVYTAQATGNGRVLANQGREGGGSVDLQISLKSNIMNVLELDEEFMSFVSLL